MRTLLFLLSLAVIAIVKPAMADTSMRIVVPSHDVPRGVTLGDSDLEYQNVDAADFRAGTVTSMNQLDGMETRRLLRAGEAVRVDDVRHPILVTKGETVTMTFNAPGLTLTATGRAMSEGGLGETVTVQNPVSFRQITGVVIGAGEVRAGDITNVTAQLASIQP
jgi:flagella basal body P-ring formation protein FlgA